MLKVLFSLVCAVPAGAGAIWVYTNLVEFFSKWISYGIAAGIFALIFALLYFLFAKPLAEYVHDRFATLKSRVMDRKTGTGLDEIPVTHYTKNKLELCKICGHPGGPVCDSCKDKLSS